MSTTSSEFPMTKSSSSKRASDRAATDSLGGDAINAGRGLCMGAADVIPGISGGTVALLFGIYERLVAAIAHIDLQLLGFCRRGEFRRAAAHIDLRFLASLAVGILVGGLAMTMVMNRLLTTDLTRSITLAALFGLIAASGVLVCRLIRGVDEPVARGSLWLLGALGAALAWWLTTLNQQAAAAPSLGYLFLCGSLGICAMILPGISGAMILLVMGVYEHVTGVIKELPGKLLHGEPLTESLLVLGVFAAGCGISLLAFSRVLRWLLDKYGPPTMAVLCGFIFGALVKIWPYQRDLSPEITEFKHKVFQPIWPDWAQPQTWAILAVGGVAFASVLLLDRRFRRRGEEAG